LRNIGILAHIDAGKTTATERMLYYSGELNRIGEVHDGDTVMDYMDQERARGITINGAAISIDWNHHRFNLVDTPGHVDFTMEVERAVRAMDGAVALFDAVSGVQAQTETVWSQATRYGVPRIGFVNKMDREGADFENTLKMISSRLGAVTLVTQIPYFHKLNAFEVSYTGVVDIVSMRLLTWDQSKSSKVYESQDLEGDYLVKALEAREILAETLGVLDDDFAEEYLESSVDLLPAESFKKAIRKACINQVTTHAVPIFCGSALKNTGIQTLMDGVIDYLPSPSEALHQQCSSSPTRALAFKVQNDPKRGPLVFIRVYGGTIESRGVYFNIRGEEKPTKERANQLLRPFADDFEQIESLEAGDIGVVVGLKSTRTGDTLSSVRDAEPLRGIQIPLPVFSVSLELESGADEKKLNIALDILTRDDPSLKVLEDPETGQLLLYGMGELHLEVAKHRLTSDFSIPLQFGKVRVALRETLGASFINATGRYQTPGEDTVGPVNVSIQVSTHPDGIDAPLSTPQFDDPSIAKNLQFTDTATGLKWTLNKEQRLSIRNSIHDSFQRGAVLGYPVQGMVVELVLSKCDGRSGIPCSNLRGATSKACRNALEDPHADPKVLEPLAKLQISIPDSCIGSVIGELTGHLGGLVHDVLAESAMFVNSERARSTVHASAPLKNMIGFSTKLRSSTAGDGSFSLQVEGFAVLSGPGLEKVLADFY